MPRGPNRPHPAISLEIALGTPRVVRDNNAGRPMSRLLLAEAMGYSPSSSAFRDRIGASARYGLTEGNYRSEMIALTPLGESTTRPRNNQEMITSLRKAVRNVPIFEQLLDYFANAKLPTADFLKNTLERDPFSIDPAWSDAVAEAFIADARHVGFLRDIGGSPHVVLDSSTTSPARPPDHEADGSNEGTDTGEGIPDVGPSASTGVAEPVDGPPVEQPSDPRERPVPMQLFIAHGKNRKPLEQLKRILDGWKVPYLVAIDEPNAGRPISEKVADTMRACSAGIFIFTADDQFNDDEGRTVSRPSGNVIYELGAASLLYGQKIVILKEQGVSFPSDFSDLGWINFEKDALEAKGMDLLREMIALNAVRLVSAGSG